MRKELSVAISALTLGIGAVVFMTANAEPLFIGEQRCGDVELVTLGNGAVRLSGVTGCDQLGGDESSGETTPPTGETTPPTGETTPPGPVNPVAGGIDKSAVWAGYNFPVVPRAGERVGLGGGSYHYYKINVGSEPYAGTIAFGPNPGGGNARFKVWISAQPGQAAIAGSKCTSNIASNSGLRYATNVSAANAATYCKLTPGTYYVNVNDGEEVKYQGITRRECAFDSGCAYYLETTAAYIK